MLGSVETVLFFGRMFCRPIGGGCGGTDFRSDGKVAFTGSASVKDGLIDFLRNDFLF